MFYLGIDGRDRIVGMVGTRSVSPTDLWLKRIFVKPEVKAKGIIGTILLATVEKYAASTSVTSIHTHLHTGIVKRRCFIRQKVL
ncbi:MAG: GNAT family N-acetyltransferase [Clostridiales bacterium]|nr:GNAT family N-acetyltransferase [Clostridiales bacterium]